MRRFIITEEQSSILKNTPTLNTKNVGSVPMFLIKDIKMNETPLSDNKCVPNRGILINLIEDGYEQSIREFSDDITSFSINEVNNKLSKLINICKKKEQPIRSSLEKLCYNSIIKTFNIPDDTIEMSFKIDDMISSDKTFNIEGENKRQIFDDIDAIKKQDDEVMKKKCINVLIMGAARKLTSFALQKSLSELFELDEELPHLYSKILKINDYLIYTNNIKITKENNCQAGYEEITFGNEESLPKLESHGLIFPILLLESFRGLLEICASNGLPEDVSYTKQILELADIVKDEPWYMRFGTPIWEKIHKCLGEYDTENIPELFRVISTLSSEDFFSFMGEIISGTNKSDTIIRELYIKAEHDSAYSSFEDDIMKRQDTPDIIEDSYFNEDEINLWENYLEDYD